MAVLFGIWIPLVIISHAIGLTLFLYGLQSLNGSISNAWRRVGPSIRIRRAAPVVYIESNAIDSPTARGDPDFDKIHGHSLSEQRARSVNPLADGPPVAPAVGPTEGSTEISKLQPSLIMVRARSKVLCQIEAA